MSEIAELVERFGRGGEMPASVLAGAQGEEHDWKPEPAKWSLRRIACHLADSEGVAAMRFRQVIAEDNPFLPWFDEPAWADNLDYAKRDPAAALETFRRIRGESYGLLKDLAEKDLAEDVWSRIGTHSKRGPISLVQILRDYAGHAESHARQIREIRNAYQESSSKQQ